MFCLQHCVLTVSYAYVMSILEQPYLLFMVALCNRADHIYFHPVVCSFFLSSFFPRLISAVAERMSAYLHTWCGLSANLRCRSETCGTRCAENTGRKKVAKNRHLGIIAQLCRAISSQPRHVSTIGKNLLSSNMSSTCPHNIANFIPLMAEIGLPVRPLGHPCKF